MTMIFLTIAISGGKVPEPLPGVRELLRGPREHDRELGAVQLPLPRLPQNKPGQERLRQADARPAVHQPRAAPPQDHSPPSRFFFDS